MFNKAHFGIGSLGRHRNRCNPNIKTGNTRHGIALDILRQMMILIKEYYEISGNESH